MILVRPLEQGDEAGWRVLWRGYLAFYETTLPEGVYAASFARMLDPAAADQHGLIALHDGAPVGLAHYIFHRHNWRLEGVTYLQDLFVAADARGLGLGRRLMQTVFDAADAAGRPEVYWLTQGFNVEARQLYDRIGTATPFIKYRR